jgi:FixJ family two-component response regulator
LKPDKFVVHVVDPDAAIADGLSTLFDTYGIAVISYPDAESYLDAMPPPGLGPCCLLVDANLPGISGPALLQKLRDERADLPLLLMISTSYPQLTETLQGSRQIGFIEKPCSNGMLVKKVLELREQA